MLDSKPEPAEAISPSSPNADDVNAHPASLDAADKTESLEPPKYVPKADDSHQGLKITTIVDPHEDHVDGEQPDIDVVHVMGIKAEDERLDLASFISSDIKSRRRESVFSVDVAGLMIGDFAINTIERQAEQLLEGLSYFRRSDVDGNSSGRAIVFVAYELGALVVKKAVSMAAVHRDRWPGVFLNSARFVFCGCFQRSLDLPTLERKMSEFLYSNRNAKWDKYLGPTCISGLARATMEMTEIFLGSRVTLYGRVVSLYASDGETKEKPAKIHPAFDYFTATMGLAVELPVQEQNELPFPDLAEKVCYDVNKWVPHWSWAPYERALVNLAFPHRQLCLQSPDCSHPILESPVHEAWKKSSGIRILCIEGADHQARQEAAEQVLLSWQTKKREKKEYKTSDYSFSFSTRDPSRDTFDGMIIALFLQAWSRFDSSSSTVTYDYWMMKDQFYVQHGWTETDVLRMFSIHSYKFLGDETVILLQDIDQCKRESLTAFWRTLAVEGTASEYPLKLVVTFKDDEASFTHELGPDIVVDKYIIPTQAEYSDHASYYDYVDSWSLRLCPNGHGQGQVLKSLLNLRNLDRGTAEQLLRIIQARTKWPAEPITENLTMLCSFLDSISRSSTPTTVLDYVLRADPDQEGLRWVLGWLLCAYRPLTRRELAMVYCRRRGVDASSKPSYTELRCANTAIENHLRGIADFSHDQVCIRDDMVALFKPGRDYIWTDVQETAPVAIMDYVLQCLSATETEARLESLSLLYESKMEKSLLDFVVPLLPDGEDIVFYAIEALPVHLSNSINRLDDLVRQFASTTGPFSAWARVYWAMSNTFSRAAHRPVSACDVLLANSNLNPDARAALRDRVGQLPVAEGGQKSLETPDEAQMISLFTQAVRLGDEEVALRYATQIIPACKEQGASEDTTDKPKLSESVSRLQWALWRATWLNMDQLACVLLENGIDANTPDVTPLASASPLFMASQVGHTRILEHLIKHGAKVDVTNAAFNALYGAACNGHADVVSILAAKDPSLIPGGSYPPLYTASCCGKWRVVEILLSHNADPGVVFEQPAGSNWKPLLIAIRMGHSRTVKLLLAKVQDLNAYGTSSVLNPLYLAAVTTPNVECVRLLLEGGANPNHELMASAPLVLELTREKTPAEERIPILELLIANDPPVQLDVTDTEVGITPLMCAAAHANAPVARWLLEHGADVNALTKAGLSALFHAAYRGHVDVVRELLPYKPQLDLKIDEGESIMEIVVDKPVILGLLLDMEPGPDLEFTNTKGGTALTCAVALRKYEVVKQLLARNANIHHRDDYGWSPILDAVGLYKDVEMTRILAERGANLQDALKDGRGVLHYAGAAEPEVLRTLLEFHKLLDLEQRDAEGRTPLIYAVACDFSKECITLLVRAGADVNAQDLKGQSALMWSIYRDSAISDLLLSQPDIKPNLHSESFGPALHNACLQLNIDIVARLLKLGADPNQAWVKGTPPSPKGGTAVTPLLAVLYPYAEADSSDRMDKIVRILVAHGAKVNDEAIEKYAACAASPLLAACLCAGVGTIRYLLDEGASTQHTDPRKYLPIHIAAANGLRNFEFVAQLHRGDLLIPDAGGRNVLHWAAEFCHVETVRYILNRVAPSVEERRRCLNLADIDGWTPLAWATRPAIKGLGEDIQSEPRDIAKTVKYLLEEGADPSIEFRIGQGDDTETFTPLAMAALCDLSEDVMELLKDAQNENTNKTENSTISKPAKKYIHCLSTCDICLSTVYGHKYECQTCNNFDACKKCYGSIQTYHGHLKTEEGAPHTFKVSEASEKEFQDPPEAKLPEEETDAPGRTEELDGEEGADAAESADAGAVENGDLETSDDEVDDGLNLDDLDNLEDDDDDGSH